jgi:hypothetical protein
MPVNTSSGSKLYIGANNTVTVDPTTDLTYKQVGFIANLGEFGRQYALITFDDLSNRNTLKFKGQRNDGKLDVDLGRAPDDLGQAAMIVALDVDNDFNFKVTLNDRFGASPNTPTTFWFAAKVMTYTCNVGGPTQVVHAKATLELASGTITEVPAT